MVCQIEDSDVKKNTLSYVPHLTLPLSYLGRTSLIIIITLLLLSLSPSTLPYLSLPQLSPNHRFPTPAPPSRPPPSSPKKQNQTKRNLPPAWGKQQPNI